MMLNSFIGSIMNMSCEIYSQQNSQSQNGNITREWVYHQTIPCRIEPMKLGGPDSRSDNKYFDYGPDNTYSEKMQLKMKSPIYLSKRSRISAVKDNYGVVIYKEFDKYGQPDMIFEVTACRAEIDPLGRVSYFETTMQRVEVQQNDTGSG